MWRDSNILSSRRRPGSRQRKGAPPHADVWTPASDGATKVGLTSSRTTTRFECGETQIYCRPGAGRDPGRERARRRTRMSRLRPPTERRSSVSHRPEQPRALNVARLKYIVVPAQAGIQAEKGRAAARGCLDSGLRRSDEGGSHIIANNHAL